MPAGGRRATATPRVVVATSATSSNALWGRVRPPVTAYGRTTGPAASSGTSSSPRGRAPLPPSDLDAHRRGQDLAGARHESGHLEGDHPRVRGGRGGDRQAGPLADRGDE